MSNKDKSDFVIVGAGIFGLYSANILLKKGYSVTVLEQDSYPFSRASSINQARIHLGHHYPRSIGTAVKTFEFFKKFQEEFSGCILSKYKNIYGIAKNCSLTSAIEFEKYCKYIGIRASLVDKNKYFSPNMIEKAYETDEIVFDWKSTSEKILEENSCYKGFQLVLNNRVISINKSLNGFSIETGPGDVYNSGNLLICAYSGVNALISMLGEEQIPVQHELVEVVLGKVSSRYKNTGITVMDGPFFSIQPYGFSGTHSLTSVLTTPHKTVFSSLPEFSCQKFSTSCSPELINNCNSCEVKPLSAAGYMSQNAKIFLKDDYSFDFKKSLFTIKTTLKRSIIDDSRPTSVKVFGSTPFCATVLSGKINTIYELKEILGEF